MFSAAKQTIPKLLAQHAALRPERPFLAHAAEGDLTYGELDQCTRQLGSALRGRGIAPGETVGLLLPNGSKFCKALLAAICAGGTVMPIPLVATADEVGYMLRHANCRMVITDPDHWSFAEQAAEAGAKEGTESVALIDITDNELFRKNAAPSPTDIEADITPDLPAILLYTSGSTARPKGIMLSHEAVISAGLCNAWHQALRPDDRQGIVLPLYHSNALFLQFFAALTAGASIYLAKGFDPQRYWFDMNAAGVTVANLVAAGLRKLLQQDGPAATARDTVRFMMYGMPMHDSELAAFEARFACPLVMVYGLTETAACGTRSPLFLERRQDRIGAPMPGWEVRILDDDGRDCPVDTPGEIWLRGPAMFSGYLNDPVETTKCLSNGGIRTGDIGYFDEHGFVVMVDRKKDLIKVRGRSVGSLEIEAVLREHPQVADAAVIGLPDNVTDERIVAFVVPVDAALDKTALLAFCAQRLSWYKVPAELVVRDALPKTSVGKVRKAELKNSIIAPRETSR